MFRITSQAELTAQADRCRTPARSLAAGAFLAVLGLWSGVAAAQADPYGIEQPAGRIAAETLFQEAVRLMDRGDYRAACPKLEASEALDMAVGTLLYLGDCYEQTGRLASAWARFSEARSLASAQNMVERERIAAERVAALESRMPRLTVVVPGRVPEGFSLRIAGAAVPAASWGTPLPVDAGGVVVEATAPDYEPFRVQLQVPNEPGARINTVVPPLVPLPELVDFGRPVPPRDTSPPLVRRVDAGKTWRTLGVTLSSFGGVGLLGGGVVTAFAVRENERSKSECPGDQRLCTPRGVDLRERAGRLADAATVAVAAGGALALTGLVFYAGPGSKQREVRMGLAPAPGRGLVLGARGAW